MNPCDYCLIKKHCCKEFENYCSQKVLFEIEIWVLQQIEIIEDKDADNFVMLIQD